MLPFVYKDGDKNLPFANDDYVFIPEVRKMICDKLPCIKAYAVKKDGSVNDFELSVGDLTDDERKIILAGCLINYYREVKTTAGLTEDIKPLCLHVIEQCQRLVNIPREIRKVLEEKGV